MVTCKNGCCSADLPEAIFGKPVILVCAHGVKELKASSIGFAPVYGQPSQQPPRDYTIEDIYDVGMMFVRSKRIIVAEGKLDADELGVELMRDKLSIDFARRGPGFCFRALVEDWSHERLVKELY